MTPTHAHQLSVGTVFETPEGFRYRVRGATGSGVLAVPLTSPAARRFRTADGAEVAFTASHEAIVISSMTEVGEVLSTSVTQPQKETSK